MPLPSTSTSYASLSSRPSSSSVPPLRSRPPASSTPSASASELHDQKAQATAAPSLHSSQLKSYLANKTQLKSKTVNPTSKPPAKRTTAPLPLPRTSTAASSSSTCSSTFKKQATKAAVLDQKLKHIQALAAPVKRTRATLDSTSAVSSRADASTSAARPSKSRKLNPQSVHQQRTTNEKSASRPASSLSWSNRTAPSDRLPAAARHGHVGSSSASATRRPPPPAHPSATPTPTSATTRTPDSPDITSTTLAQPAPVPSAESSQLHQELESLRIQLASEQSLRASTARDLLLLQAGVELMHSESASKLTSLSTQLADAQSEIAALEAHRSELHAQLIKCTKQWQDILFDELDKLERQAHDGVKVAVARTVAAKREAGVWRRRAEAAEGMVRWYEKVLGNVAEVRDMNDMGEMKEKGKRRETWAPSMARSEWGEEKEEAKRVAVVVPEGDKENASHAQIEVDMKNGAAEVDQKIKQSRRTVA